MNKLFKINKKAGTDFTLYLVIHNVDQSCIHDYLCYARMSENNLSKTLPEHLV